MFQWVTQVVAALGYFGVGTLTFLENLCPPIPSELVIPLAGFVAGRGDLRLDLVIAAASAGSLAGALVWYQIGRSIGEVRLRRWIERHGKWVTLTTDDVDRANGWFARHGGLAVFVGRLVPGVRTIISVPAGVAGMSLRRFIVYSALGTLIWTTMLAWAGSVLQANFLLVRDYVDVLSIVTLAVLGGVLAWRYVRCWRTA